jgi:hypothetical protein
MTQPPTVPSSTPQDEAAACPQPGRTRGSGRSLRQSAKSTAVVLRCASNCYRSTTAAASGFLTRISGAAAAGLPALSLSELAPCRARLTRSSAGIRPTGHGTGGAVGSPRGIQRCQDAIAALIGMPRTLDELSSMAGSSGSSRLLAVDTGRVAKAERDERHGMHHAHAGTSVRLVDVTPPTAHPHFSFLGRPMGSWPCGTALGEIGRQGGPTADDSGSRAATEAGRSAKAPPTCCKSQGRAYGKAAVGKVRSGPASTGVSSRRCLSCSCSFSQPQAPITPETNPSWFLVVPQPSCSRSPNRRQLELA